MIQTIIYNDTNTPSDVQKRQIIDFLHTHLEEFGDPKADIEKAFDYSLKVNNAPGGFVIVSIEKDEITGAVLVNKTGMKGYIPDNILVYIATHKRHRGKGIGKELISRTIDIAEGDIALHVEPENPAKGLYELFGFTNKYLEMRLKKGG